MENIDITVRLSAQRALWGNVPASLRSVSVEVQNHTLRWRCLFDDNATEDDIELLSVASAEFIASFSEEYSLDEEYTIVAFPQELVNLQWLIYYRHEHNYYQE